MNPVPYLSPSSLHLIVMPTEQCNLRCTYCYEDFALEKMSPETVAGIKRLLDSRAPELSELVLDWFGGEPLLAADIVEEVQQHALRLAEAHPALHARGSMTTNAVKLDLPMFERMVAAGVVDYQISLDGPKEHHDTKRVHAGGQPTFDRIWRNLVAASRTDLDFRIMLRIHVDGDNEASLPRLLDSCRETFGGDPRFRVWFRPLSKLGGNNDETLNVLEEQEDDARVKELRQLSVDAGLSEAPCEKEDADPMVCYASRANSFVIRSDGYLGKCTVALSNPRNRVGRLRPDGTVDIETERMLPWMRGLFSGEKSELMCPLQTLEAS